LGLVVVRAGGIHGHNLLDGDHVGVLLIDDEPRGSLINGDGGKGMDGNADHDDGHTGDDGPLAFADHAKVIAKVCLFFGFLIHGNLYTDPEIMPVKLRCTTKKE
jgi:hypothetical protein